MQWVGVSVLILGLFASGWCSTDDEVDEFKAEFKIYHETGVQTERFQEFVDKYALDDETRNSNWQENVYPLEPRVGICVLCSLAVNTVLDAWALGVPTVEIGATIVDLCVSFNLAPENVCQGVIFLNLDVMEYIYNNTATEYMTAKRLCNIAFGSDGCGQDDPSLEWTVDLGDSIKPPVIDVPTETRDTVNIMHITDIHYDRKYLVGGNVDCGEPMCCRNDQGVPEFENVTAGRWGDYRNCDIPWEVVTDAMTHIKETHEVDYIYMTGDFVDHGVWETSVSYNNETLVQVHNLVRETFVGTQVFPCIGNHEPTPVNVIAPSEVTQDNVSTRWLYESLADLWSAWLPADTRETILRGGFYTVLVRPGFRVIALNNQQCLTSNWFLFYNHQDPDGQLQWLIEVLLAAEAADEKVHILYHIPMGGGSCYYRWSREYNRIVDRFESTITGQFSGHTHHDEYQLFYAHDGPDRANNVMFGGGSLTSASNVNPNYRLYNVDSDSWNVVDHETWIYNLTEANIGPAEKLRWFKMYSFKEAFGVASLSPADLDALAHQMVDDNSLMQQYFHYYHFNSDPTIDQDCDLGCQNRLLCTIVKSDSSNTTRCEQISTEKEERSMEFN